MKKKDNSHIKNVIDENIDIDFSFDDINHRIDYDKYDKKPVKRIFNLKNLFWIVPTSLCVACLIPLMPSLLNDAMNVNPGDSDEHKNPDTPDVPEETVLTRNYSSREIKEIKTKTYKRANEFEYPTSSKLQSVSSDYQTAVNNFAYTMFDNIDLDSNGLFSPLSLYLHTDIIYHGVGESETETKSLLNNILGATAKIREDNFNKAFLNNRVKGNDYCSHIEMYNGFFMNDSFTYNENYLSYLTKYYVEAYYLDTLNELDITNMCRWVDRDATRESLGLPDDLSKLSFLWTVLNFCGNWDLEKEATKDDYFYPTSGDKYSVPFMYTTLYDKIYNYGTYWTFNIEMDGGFNMEFIVPSNRSIDIYQAVKESKRNFLFDDEKYLYKSNNSSTEYTYAEIRFPKFETKNRISYKNALINLGLGHLFNEEKSASNLVVIDMFDNKNNSIQNAYLYNSEQFNKISWQENGVSAQSITKTEVISDGSMVLEEEGLSFTLNSPFIYVIKDRNNLPIYLGKVDRP